MPYARRTARKTRRKYRKRTYKRKNKVASFYKAPMPNRFATKLRYVSYADIDPGLGGTAGVQIVNAMGCYDPDVTGIGHQPRALDQLMTMYDHYTVIGSKITVQFMHKFNNNGYNLMIGIAVKDSTTPYADPNDYLEGRNVVSSILPATHATDTVPTRTLSKTFSTKKFMGISHPLSSSNSRGSASNNPGDAGFFHIFVAPFQAVDNSPIIVQYRIDYLVVFTEPKQPAQS